MAELFNLEIHTPYHLFYSKQAEAVVVTLMNGEIGVYANHSPFTAPVVTSVLKIKDQEGVWKEAFVAEGIIEVKRRKVVLLVQAAEWPEEIDYDRAMTAKQKAGEILEAKGFKFETATAAAKLKRAETRLKVYAGSGKK